MSEHSSLVTRTESYFSVCKTYLKKLLNIGLISQKQIIKIKNIKNMQQRDAYFTCHQSLDVNSGLGWQPLLVLKANSVFLAGHISILAKLKCQWSYKHAVLLVKETKRISAEQHLLQGRNHLFTVEKIFLYVHTHESLSIKTLLSKITTCYLLQRKF